MYLWTAMFAFPTVIAAFYPLWISVVVALVIAFASLVLMRRSFVKSKKSPTVREMATHE